LFLLSIKSLVFRHWILVWLLMWSNLVSFTYAASPQHSFPNIPFATFSDTIQSIFGPNISLATVLAILFTLQGLAYDFTVQLSQSLFVQLCVCTKKDVTIVTYAL